MKEKLIDQCQDPTQKFKVELPCQLAERLERHARENDTTIANIIIESLDTFFREND